MKKCQNCGFELADNMNFCPQCHARYEAPASAPADGSDFLPQCHAEYSATCVVPPERYSPLSYKKYLCFGLVLGAFGGQFFYSKRKILAAIMLLIGLGFFIACAYSYWEYCLVAHHYRDQIEIWGWGEMMDERWGNFLGFFLAWAVNIVLAFVIKTDGSGARMR